MLLQTGETSKTPLVVSGDVRLLWPTTFAHKLRSFASTIMVVLLADNLVMARGLELAGFDAQRRNKSCQLSNIKRFATWYGSRPNVVAKMWEALQTTPVAAARIDHRRHDLDDFLMALHFLKAYPVERVLSGIFKICEKSARKWCWFFCSKLAALKGEKVRYRKSCCAPEIHYRLINLSSA